MQGGLYRLKGWGMKTFGYRHSTIGPGANIFIVPLNPSTRTHARTHTHAWTQTHSHSRELLRQGWTGHQEYRYTVGWSIMGLWTAVFYLFIHSFIHSFILLRLDVSLSTPREWETDEKSNWASASVKGGQQQDQAAWWRKEEGYRGAWDKHGEISYQQTGTPRESVLQNDQGDGETNVRHREWQQRWGVCSECWLAESFPPPQQLHLQKDAREFTEKLAKFVTFSSRIFERKELNACPKLPPGPK